MNRRNPRGTILDSALDSWIAVDEEGNAELRVKYMFTDDYDRGAVGDAHVTVLGPDLKELAVVDVPTATGVLHGGEDNDGDGEADGIVVYGVLPAGVGGSYNIVLWMAEVCAAPGRDSNPRRGLPGDGDGIVDGVYEVVSAKWMPDATYKGEPVEWGARIWRHGDSLYPRVKVRTPAGYPGPSKINVRIRGGVTDPTGFTMPLKKWFYYREGEARVWVYRPFAGEEPTVGAATDEDTYVIGVAAGVDDDDECFTHDDGTTIDSDAFYFGDDRGLGREQADEGEAVVLANLDALQAAGLERLWVESIEDASKHDTIPGNNQADVLYFSGHGTGMGCIYGGGGLLESTTIDDIGPRSNWSRDLNVVVLSCCTVMDWKDVTTAGREEFSWSNNHGLHWARECINSDTSIVALCGYWGKGPSDNTSPVITDDIASRMSSRLASEDIEQGSGFLMATNWGWANDLLPPNQQRWAVWYPHGFMWNKKVSFANWRVQYSTWTP